MTSAIGSLIVRRLRPLTSGVVAGGWNIDKEEQQAAQYHQLVQFTQCNPTLCKRLWGKLCVLISSDRNQRCVRCKSQMITPLKFIRGHVSGCFLFKLDICSSSLLKLKEYSVFYDEHSAHVNEMQWQKVVGNERCCLRCDLSCMWTVLILTNSCRALEVARTRFRGTISQH